MFGYSKEYYEFLANNGGKRGKYGTQQSQLTGFNFVKPETNLNASVNKVPKPDINTNDLIIVLKDSSDTRKMFTLLGKLYISENNPNRFIRLMNAAKLVFAKDYMTFEVEHDLMHQLDVKNLTPRKKWEIIHGCCEDILYSKNSK